MSLGSCVSDSVAGSRPATTTECDPMSSKPARALPRAVARRHALRKLLEHSDLVGVQRTVGLAAHEHLEHRLAVAVEELDRAALAAHERAAHEGDRRAALGPDVAADRARAVQVEVAAAELARRDRALALEHDAGRVDDEQHVAPRGQRLHDVGERGCRREAAMAFRQHPGGVEGRDAVLARERLDDAVGIGGEAPGERGAGVGGGSLGSGWGGHIGGPCWKTRETGPRRRRRSRPDRDDGVRSCRRQAAALRVSVWRTSKPSNFGCSR